MSIQTGVISEYTRMIVIETMGKKVSDELEVPIDLLHTYIV